MAAEEAAAAEAERLRLEEIERKKIAAEDAVFEAEEAARVAAADAKLASQAEAAALVDAAHAEELAHLRRAEREAYEWDRFASCCSRPDPRDPRAMLAYETAARASTDSGLSRAAPSISRASTSASSPRPRCTASGPSRRARWRRRRRSRRVAAECAR